MSYLKLEGGTINPGATVAVGQTYVVSATAGGIALESDIGSGVFMSLIGIGISTSQIKLASLNTATAHA